MGNVVEWEVFRDHLGVGATDPQVDDASKLYDAINAEIRRITKRSFEGDEGATYDEVIRIFGASEFTLPHVPVEEIVSIARVRFDGTEDDPLEAERYRLEDADRGRIRIRPHYEYVHVVWSVTGDIPAQLPQAALEWGKARWEDRGRVAALTSYQTGGDAESYSVTLAGLPPRQVVAALLGVANITGGGVI